MRTVSEKGTVHVIAGSTQRQGDVRGDVRGDGARDGTEGTRARRKARGTQRKVKKAVQEERRRRRRENGDHVGVGRARGDARATHRKAGTKARATHRKKAMTSVHVTGARVRGQGRPKAEGTQRRGRSGGRQLRGEQHRGEIA